MNLPYRYRGLSLVGLLALLLPWAAWHFALSDTFGAWRECGRLERRLDALAPTTPATGATVPAAVEAPELILSGGLLDSVRRFAPAGVRDGLCAGDDVAAGRDRNSYGATDAHWAVRRAAAHGRDARTASARLPPAVGRVADRDTAPHPPHAAHTDALHTTTDLNNRIEMRRYLIYFPLLFLMVSCEIIEEDISGRAVTTIAPADDAEVPAGETLFRWRAVDRATGYELCVATEGRIVADTLLAADTLGLARSYGCRLRLEAGRYEWTVAAFNSGYETSSPALRLTAAEEPVPEEPEKSDNPESAEP